MNNNIMIPAYFRSLLPVAWLTVCFAMPGNAASPAGTNSWEVPGAYEYDSVKYEWHDDKRNRDVPVKIYFPKDARGKFPVILFSHGLGGSREGYGYLGRYWASHGYISVHLNHIGSDAAVWEGVPFADIKPKLAMAARNPANIINRPPDVSFAIDQLEKLNRDDSQWRDRLDLDHIGVSGHSFGGYTTLAIAGEVYILPDGSHMTMGDPRIKAAVAMSAPAPTNKKDLDLSFSKIKIPIFHMTGTLDDSPIGETKAAERRIPFDHTHTTNQFLVIFNGGDHMIFSGRPSTRNAHNSEKDPLFQKLICTGSTAFWDAYLKDDASAARWLKGGGYASVLGDDGVFSKK